MSSPPDLRPRRFASHLPGLGFELCVPRDWLAQPGPIEADPAACATGAPAPQPVRLLADMRSADGQWRCTVEARPAEGLEPVSMSQQVRAQLQARGLALCSMGVGQLGPLPALTAEALREPPGGALFGVEHWHLAWARHGAQVFELSLAGPLARAVEFDPTWYALLDSFTLLQGPEAASAWVTPSVPDDAGALGTHALADDAAALDAAHPINAGLARRGVGRVPTLLQLDLGTRRAWLLSHALQARLAVPLGWHVIDDGRRLLLLEPSGMVQVHLDLLARLGRSAREWLDTLEADARERHPGVESLRLREGAQHGLALRGLQQGRRAIEQLHLLRPGPDGETLLRARVTSTPERMHRATQLTEAVLAQVGFDDVGALAPASQRACRGD